MKISKIAPESIILSQSADPGSLPFGGGDVFFTYKVINTGSTPLNNVTLRDNKCYTMSGKLGDTNGNYLLDPNEVWLFSCTNHLEKTTTNSVLATAYSNDQKITATSTLTLTVKPKASPLFPETGGNSNLKFSLWWALSGILTLLIFYSFLTGTHKSRKKKWKSRA